MESNELTQRILAKFPDAQIETQGENCSFELLVVSEGFNGQRPLKRQQAILALFSEELKSGKLHALGVKAKTPEELAAMPSNLIQIKGM